MLLALTGMAATAGFAVFNFPRGRLFCGDAGAYLIGYLIAVIVILLVLRQKTVSPWFALAVVIHPVTETLYSAWRRWRLGLSPTHPDARHMHSLWAANMQQRADESGLRIGLGTNAGALPPRDYCRAAAWIVGEAFAAARRGHGKRRPRACRHGAPPSRAARSDSRTSAPRPRPVFSR